VYSIHSWHVVQVVGRIALQAAQLALLAGVVVEPGLHVAAVAAEAVSNQAVIQVHSEARRAAKPGPRFCEQLMPPLCWVSWRIAVASGMKNSSPVA
jgi:hypothetical protein